MAVGAGRVLLTAPAKPGRNPGAKKTPPISDPSSTRINATVSPSRNPYR